VAVFISIWLTTKRIRSAKLEKMNTRILLIGQGLFLDGLTHILSEQPNTEIIGAVSSWKAAENLVAERQPDIIIVDHNEEELRETDLAPLLENQIASVKVIYLTLAANKMIIHNRQQFDDVTMPDLLKALGSSDEGGTA
jgi:response regulator of citrate/malate metabolism